MSFLIFILLLGRTAAGLSADKIKSEGLCEHLNSSYTSNTRTARIHPCIATDSAKRKSRRP